MGAAHHRGTSEQSVETPQAFLDRVVAKFGTPVWDLAASAENAKAARYFTEEENSLIQEWPTIQGVEFAWLNPPYGNIRPWVQKAAESPQCRTLMLVPASVGANWYRDWCHPYAHTYILNGRITFVGHKDPFPKDLMLLDYIGSERKAFDIWRWQDDHETASPPRPERRPADDQWGTRQGHSPSRCQCAASDGHVVVGWPGGHDGRV